MLRHLDGSGLARGSEWTAGKADDEPQLPPSVAGDAGPAGDPAARSLSGVDAGTSTSTAAEGQERVSTGGFFSPGGVPSAHPDCR